MNKRPHVVIIDHFDSFTYNLVVAFENLGATVQVFRTNVGAENVRGEEPTHIVLSPGPGHPKDVPLFQEVIARAKSRIPILGVCLGGQALGLHFGTEVVRSPAVMHGKTSDIVHNGLGIFENVNQNPLTVCRYHSLCIRQTAESRRVLLETAWSEDGTVMAVESGMYPHVVGVQFHPESLFTPEGLKLLENFLALKATGKVTYSMW